MHADGQCVFLWLYNSARISECRLWYGVGSFWIPNKVTNQPHPHPFPNHQRNTQNLYTKPPAKYRHDSNSPYSWGVKEGCIL